MEIQLVRYRMAVTDAVASLQVLGGSDSFVVTNFTQLDKERRQALAAQIRQTSAERIFNLGQNQPLPAITDVGRAVDTLA